MKAKQQQSQLGGKREHEPALAFSVPGAAHAAHISRATLYNLWREGGGPKRARIRGRVVVTRESLQAWLRSLEETAA